MTYTEAQIAQVCHEANRALQQIHLSGGDRSVSVSPPWSLLDEETRLSAIEGVRGVLVTGKTAEESHDAWCDFKRAHGWKYGPVKNEITKQHPCLVPYDQLPDGQQDKDHLFAAVATALGTIRVSRDDLVAELPPALQQVRLYVMHSMRGDGKTTCGLDREALPSGHVAVTSGANCQDCAGRNERGEQIREFYLGPREQPADKPVTPDEVGSFVYQLQHVLHKNDFEAAYGGDWSRAEAILEYLQTRSKPAAKTTVGTVYVDVVPRIRAREDGSVRIGDRVHYVSHGSPFRAGVQAYQSECRAAVVTEQYAADDRVGLFVMNPTGTFHNQGVEADQGDQVADAGSRLCNGCFHEPGTWHWPAQ